MLCTPGTVRKGLTGSRVAGLGYVPFRDPSYWPSEFDLTVLDVLHGLEKAKQCGWMDFENFDLEEFTFFEKVTAQQPRGTHTQPPARGGHVA